MDPNKAEGKKRFPFGRKIKAKFWTLFQEGEFYNPEAMDLRETMGTMAEANKESPDQMKPERLLILSSCGHKMVMIR
ncbi:hypothetical protein TNIN_62861 [Trichonephila inaurata madagascariensis]|uniref:Uncharacterized protein n=1 Tax=Trichonephila inaurata madagascariensis TaxID=2747483 RepID=A0A8X6XBJ2_9ARAC|nr:hypothetical protein TNIN_62861 [Trichonephila inaurata madagascariensis]